MKRKTATKLMPCFMAIVMMALCAVTTARAAAPALQGFMMLRPLTPQEAKDPSLAGAQTASGLSAVAIGQPAYLDALVNINIADSNITSVVWSLTSKPTGSMAVLTNSPLGANILTYNPSEKSRSKVAGRTMLKPDLVGQYVVNATITTVGSGSTNVSQRLTAATYVGINSCVLCHSGGLYAPDVYHPWSGTLHSRAFMEAIDGLSTDHFSQNCIKCHVVGFDANTNTANGGFDDIAAQTGWQFPS